LAALLGLLPECEAWTYSTVVKVSQRKDTLERCDTREMMACRRRPEIK
jgi:hypothetical protein